MLKLCAISLFFVFVATACGGDDAGTDQTAIPSRATATSPSTNPTAAATPADAPSGSVIEDGYTTTLAFPQLNFDRMVEIALIPGDDEHAVVLTQDGTVRRFSLVDETEQPTMFLDIRDRIITDAGNEEGLLGITFAPDYEDTRRFYVDYSSGPPRQNTLARFEGTADVADPASEKILIAIDDPFANHNGGGLEFGPDGYLYWGIGDGGAGGDPQGNGQNTDALLGKILRVDVSGDDYSIPDDNPFAAGGGRPEIFAYGLRNPWRITFDRETGDLWAGDVGQGTREEVDLIELGGNYGWNTTEGDLCFEPSEGCDRTGLVEPRTTYANGNGNCSVTGGYVYRGSELPELIGWYIYGDFCSGVVWGLDTEDPAAEPVQLAETEKRIPSFGEGPDGELYIVTFGNEVVRFTRK
jgi:glucose/arabinose dehydrogenase